MRTSSNRFSKCNTLFRGADGVTREAVQYSYESGKALYDVILIEGAKFVRVNMGQLSNRIDAWTPHHYAIEAHFGLCKQDA